MSSIETETKLLSTDTESKITLRSPSPSSSVYSQEIPNTSAHSAMSPLNVASTPDVGSSLPLPLRLPTSEPTPAPTPTLALPSPLITPAITTAALDLNAALADLSRQLCRVRWAIGPLQTVISAVVDPKGESVDRREREGTDEKTETKINDDAQRKSPDHEKNTVEKGSAIADIGSEMAGDFTGAWETNEEWGIGRLGER
jgi:hypothetical protein